MNILITTFPFGVYNSRSLELLEAAHLSYQINPFCRRVTEPELIELVGDKSVLIAGTEPITARAMDAAPHLRLIARVGIGLDNVDLDAARERGIAVTYTPEAPSAAVAELAIGQILALLRKTSNADRGIRQGIWNRRIGRRLGLLTVGIIGVG